MRVVVCATEGSKFAYSVFDGRELVAKYIADVALTPEHVEEIRVGVVMAKTDTSERPPEVA